MAKEPGVLVDDFRAFSLHEEKPIGRGKLTVKRYQGEKSFHEYIPQPHACFLGKKVKRCENPDGDGIDFEITLWFTGGYRTGDENIVVDDNKYIHELVLHIKRADIIIWKTTTVKSIVFPACMVSSSFIQWSDNSFLIFAWYDPQLRNTSNTLLELSFTSDDSGKIKREKIL